MIGVGFLALMLVACLATLPYTLGIGETTEGRGVVRYNEGQSSAGRLPPVWLEPTPDQMLRLHAQVPAEVVATIAKEHNITPDAAIALTEGPVADALLQHWPAYFLGTDALGRSLLIRVLAGGGISLVVGIAAAALSVFIGTAYGAISGYVGGRVDGVMMRIVDVLYGLPYVLLVVLLAVASDAMVGEYLSRQRERTGWMQEQAALMMRSDGASAEPDEVRAYLRVNEPIRKNLESDAFVQFPPRQLSDGARVGLDLLTLLVAIGGVSWLTMARVVRGQVLSLKSQPFIEAARAMGLPTTRIFLRHLLPNLVGVITVYATLTVPQAMLQESFLSFLGIGVKPPLPSWGNLAAEGLGELNPYQSHWWLLVFPCLMLGTTLLAMNFVGEGLREAMDPKRARR
jgi:ABC-type dipeptide/oligopeptide/nickel transport system permease subunit